MIQRFLAVALLLLLPYLVSAQRFVKSYDTVLLMIAAPNLQDVNTNLFCNGYRTVNDGGGGLFTFDRNSAATANGVTVFQPTLATGRLIRDYSGPLNVRWAGAYGNGINDDTAAIQVTLNTAAELGNGYSQRMGGAVDIPAGTYKVSSVINLPDGLTIVGAARNSTFIMNHGVNNDVLKLQKNSQGLPVNLVLKNLTIASTNAAPTGGASICITNSGFGNDYVVEIDNVHVHGGFIGLRLERLATSKLSGVTADTCASVGFLMSGASTSTKFENCFAHLCSTNGYQLYGSYLSLISCASDSNAGSGYFITNSVNVTMTSCGAENNAFDGVHMWNSTQIGLLIPYIQPTNSLLGSRDGIRIDGGSDIVLMNVNISVPGASQRGYSLFLTNLSGAMPERVTVMGRLYPYSPLGEVNYPDRLVWINGNTIDTTVTIGRGRFSAVWPDNRIGLRFDPLMKGDNSFALGLQIAPIFTNFNSGGVAAMGIQAEIETNHQAAATGLHIYNMFSNGTNAFVTNYAGLVIDEPLSGTANNAALTIALDSLSLPGDYGIYNASTNKSYFLSPLGIGVNVPDAVAMLDVTSTTKTFVPPRMTLAQRNAIVSPPNGSIIYQSDGTPGLYGYISGVWTAMASSGGSGTVTHTAGALTLDLPVFGNGLDDIKVGTKTGTGTTAMMNTGPTASDMIITGSLQLPNGAAPTTDAFGEIAGDNNAWAVGRGTVQLFDGTANAYVVAALASDVPGNGQVPTWNTGGTVTWETPAVGGAVAISSLIDAAADNVLFLNDFEQNWEVGLTNKTYGLRLSESANSALGNVLEITQVAGSKLNALQVRRMATNIFTIGTNGIMFGVVAKFVEAFGGAYTASSPAWFDANTNLVSGTQTGTGSQFVASQSPTLVTPVIGQISSSTRITGIVTNDALTASAAVVTDANKALASVAYTGAGNVMRTRTGVWRSFSIPAGAFTPSITNGATAGTNNTFGADYSTVDTFDFDDTTAESVEFAWTMPAEWDAGTVKYKAVFFSAAATSGAAVFELKAKSIADNEAVSASWGTGINVTKTVSGTANRQNITANSAALTVAGAAIGERVYWKLSRLPADGSDTLVGDARVAEIVVFYLESTTEASAP